MPFNFSTYTCQKQLRMCGQMRATVSRKSCSSFVIRIRALNIVASRNHVTKHVVSEHYNMFPYFGKVGNKLVIHMNILNDLDMWETSSNMSSFPSLPFHFCDHFWVWEDTDTNFSPVWLTLKHGACIEIQSTIRETSFKLIKSWSLTGCDRLTPTTFGPFHR